MNVSKHKTHPACGKLSWVGLVSTYVKRSGNAIVGNCCRRINKSPLCILFHRTQCSVEFCARVPLLSALDLQSWCLASALTSILESFPNPNKCRDRTQLTSGLPTMCMDNNNMTTRWKFNSWKRQNQVTVVFDTHSLIHISTFLRVLRLPVPPSGAQLPRYHSANPSFIPRLQLGVIASMECLVCPLHPHTTDNQQWKYMSGLVLMVFRSRANSSSRSATDARRHGGIIFYRTFIFTRPLSAGGAWKLSSDHRFHLCSWSRPDPETFPLYRVACWNGVAFQK